MRQVAALPYRLQRDGRVAVMLITSRETRRWVLPKGNPIRGLRPHEAAAQEAWEEAGLTGLACPAPIGRYRYLKRRPRGDRMLDVDVFPFAVLSQAETWPEATERATRWFDLDKAARAVEEPELRTILADFRRPGPSPRCNMGVETPPPSFRRFPMLAWFQALMPKQGRFFELFEAHAATLVDGADALARLLGGEGDPNAQVAAIRDHEHKADRITCEVLQDVRRVFVTPFDRSAITGLIGVMDDAIDEMNGFAKAIDLFGLSRFDPGMRDIGGIVVEAARVTAEIMPLLRSLGGNSARLNTLTERLIQLEGQADDIHDAGLKTLFGNANGDPMRFIVGREMYSRLEKIVDRFEDVANEVQGIVIDHA